MLFDCAMEGFPIETDLLVSVRGVASFCQCHIEVFLLRGLTFHIYTSMNIKLERLKEVWF